MLVTGLIMAAAIVGAAPQATTPAQNAPAATTAPAPPPAANRRAMVCENRPVTGRRINQRRCRTRAQDDAARSNAQDYAAQMQVVTSGTEASILGGSPR
ncbi:hypothetical protein ACETK8_18525 [Brevundimonas staleyi]|uniref:Uncharacterized protein n=1 Tax=Brevundimonas staleyi TaxID=74326 RepID=A0ABW0FU16_9CAUL